MIFVTVGTTRFEELIKKIDEIAIKIDDKIIMQIGKGEYKPKKCKYFTFKKDITPYLKNANLVITHGGAGTLFELLELKKRVIGVNNKQLIDEHQSDLLGKLSDEKYIIWCNNMNDLQKKIIQSKTFKYKIYNEPKCEIGRIILK